MQKTNSSPNHLTISLQVLTMICSYSEMKDEEEMKKERRRKEEVEVSPTFSLPRPLSRSDATVRRSTHLILVAMLPIQSHSLLQSYQLDLQALLVFLESDL